LAEATPRNVAANVRRAARARGSLTRECSTTVERSKAAFVAAAFQSMEKLLGPLHGESYVHVDDVRGDAYGYGGLTQERRYIAAQLKAPVAAAA
jgi:hypothetical protein